MEIIETVNLDTLTPEEKEALESGVKTEEDILNEYKTSLEAEKAKEEEKFRKTEENYLAQKVRAEKAEALLKGSKGEKEIVAPKTDDSLSQTDLIAILKADVPEEDIPEIVDYSKLKNISVAEALKSSVVKTILSEKKEERKTAEATSTGGSRKGAVKASPSQLLSDAEKGVLPDSDEELAALIKARMGL